MASSVSPSVAPVWTPARVRVRSFQTRDFEALEAFVAGYASDGTLLPIHRSDIERGLLAFRVALVGPRIVGSGAIRPVTHALAEVRSLAVDAEFQGNGLGSRLLRALVGDARRRGHERLFCLTRRVDFFERHGFVCMPKERYPHKIWDDCRVCPRRHACDETAMERTITRSTARHATAVSQTC
jgi:amino-acid N-acetyltransferase